MIFDKKQMLACESCKGNEGGILTDVVRCEGIDIVKTVISSESAALSSGREIGTYLTVCQGELYRGGDFLRDKLSRAVSFAISEILSGFEPKPKKLLFVGLGNRELSSDKIGVGISDALLPIEPKKRGEPSLALISPGVLSLGGIHACDHIRGLIKIKHFDGVIVADALMTKHPERLLATVQVSDTGITPASGTQKERNGRAKSHEISRKTLGVPVISLGVATVISIGEGFYTPYTIDVEIEPICKIIADGITLSLTNG